MAMKIMPKTMTGQLNISNRGSCDWGWQRLLAYGCQSCVVVVDPATVQTIQVLDHHRGHVVKVKWARENYHHDLASPYTLRLAAADTTGRIVIWDVSRAVIGAECVDGGRSVADMDWVAAQDASHDLLAAIHPPSTLILWNTENGSRLWKKTYSDLLLSFAFDPFDPSRLAFLGQDCIVFVDDFSLSGAPMSSGKKFHISSPSSSSIVNSASAERISSDKRSSIIGSTSTRSTIRRVSSILVGGEGPRKSGEEENSVGGTGVLHECIQLSYHKACRQHLILVYAREILILDLDIGQTVCVIPTERTGSPFAFVLPLRECDAMLCIHESGSMSLRVRRRNDGSLQTATISSPVSDEEPIAGGVGVDVIYDSRCQSDSLRITKHNRASAAAVCPVTERQAALITNDGRVLFWEVSLVNNGQSQQLEILASDVVAQSSVMSLADLVGMVDEGRVAVSSDRQNSVIKLMMTGLLNGVSSAPAVLRMCPPLTTKNFSVYRPLLAVGGGGGGSVGTVQIFDLSGGYLWREYVVHTCAVRGIEWISRRGFLSFAYPTMAATSSNGAGLVRNEIMLTDIDTGRSVPLRTNIDDESPIEGIRTSYLKQYFAILFRDRPFELWDLRTLTLLRRMPKTFPHTTALEWSPSHGGGSKTAKKKPTTPEANGPDAPSSVMTSSSMLDLATTPSSQTPSSEFGEDRFPTSSTPAPALREHFVFTDINGLLYHFIIEGNLVRDGSKIPPDSGMGSITCIAWKAETLVLSDVDGNLNLWDLRGKVSRAVATGRGWIRKIRFAPGRGNMKLSVLYLDGNGIDIWDAKEVERVASVRCPKDLAKVIDVEWAASDRPVLVCADGCIRVMDISCLISCSPIDEYQLMDTIFCPHSLPARSGLVLRSLLQNRSSLRDSYSEDCQSSLDGSSSLPVMVTDKLELLDGRLRKYMESSPLGVAARCLITARLFGDESELIFWTVAQYYIQAAVSGSYKNNGDISNAQTPAGNPQSLLIFDEIKETDSNSNQNKLPTAAIRNSPLGTCHDVVRDNRTFGDYERRRAALHDTRRVPGEPTRRCADDLILLGDADRAVQLLLETDPSDAEKFYVDSLRACLVASVRSSGASQSTIKLVATNLIACGRLSEGVQLLCLIEKGADACRYLQTYGQWRDAARLAKTTLGDVECVDVMRRWADHLASPAVDRRSLATLVLLSLGRFSAVVDLLVSVRHFDRAALFIEACREFGLLADCPASEIVFSGYARFMFGLGLNRMFEYYCHKAGEKGKILLAELQQN